MREYDNITIEEIIQKELITTVFQPLVSFKRKTITGFEALSRGFNPNDNSLINPLILIREAGKAGLTLELDRLFRKKALQNFARYYEQNSDCVLSINLESNAIREGLGSGNLIKSVEKEKIPPSSVIIEILESEVDDISILRRFVDEHRKMGFMIALDDFGAGFSNWDRIILLKPDLIKLDRSIISGIDRDFYKQEVAESVIKLSHNTGSIVIAEGVETESEAIKALAMDADMIQGFLTGPPLPINEINPELIRDKMNTISKRYIEERNIKTREEEKEREEYIKITERISGALSERSPFPPEDTLSRIISTCDCIECAYILDHTGVQLSGTVINSDTLLTGRNRIFRPDGPGTDQSYKDYYYSLVNGRETYITRPYLSSATGNLCTTVSKKYRESEGFTRILCVDIKMEHDFKI